MTRGPVLRVGVCPFLLILRIKIWLTATLQAILLAVSQLETTPPVESALMELTRHFSRRCRWGRNYCRNGWAGS